MNANGYLEKHQAAYYLWEAGLKLLGCVATAEYTASETRPADLDLLVSNLDRPSVGRWWEIARRLLPFLADSRPYDAPLRSARDLLLGPARRDLPRAAGLDAFLLEELEQAPGSRSTVRLAELFDRLVRYRNRELGHGAAGQRRGEYYGRAGGALLAGVAEVLGRLDVLLGRRLLFISEVRRRGTGGWIVERYELMGEAPARLESLEVADSPEAALPVPERVYLERSGGDADSLARLIPLNPFAIFDADDEDLFLLNGRKGEGRLEYLSYQSGLTVEREPPKVISASTLRRVPPEAAAAPEPVAKQSRTPAGEPEAVRRIGEFEILSRIGHGGMGIVYRAWQPSLGRQVALKCLLGPGDPKVEARFAKEIRALGRVDHPNLVKVHMSGSDGDRWFYAMELIEGADLASIVSQLSGSSASDIDAKTWQSAYSSACAEARRRETPASSSSEGVPAATARPVKAPRALPNPGAGPIERSVETVRQAAEAAHALHEAGVVHRDIKPGNIMLTADGSHAVLMDLGLAQIADDAEGRLTHTRQFVGTLRYASPEQLLAAAPVDRRADIYSLGATLWEMLTLRPLFGAGDGTPTPELMLRIQSQEPDLVRRHNLHVPADLEAVVLKCLEKQRTRRYATAADLAEDLARWQRGEPVLARPPTARYLLAKYVRRHRARFAIVAAILILALAGAGISFWHIDRARRAAEAALFDLYTTSGVEAASHENSAEAVLRFSEAAKLAGPETPLGRASLVRARNWLRGIPLPVRAFQLEQASRTLWSISFDPTGLFLLVRGNGGRCEVWSVDDERRLALPGEEREVAHAAWNPRKTVLALGGKDGALDLWSVPSGVKLRSLLGPGTLHAIEYSRDGRRLAAAGDRVRVWDLTAATGPPIEIEHPRAVKGISFDPGGGRLVTACEDGLARVIDVTGSAPRFLLPPLRNVGPGFPSKGIPVRPIFVDAGRGVVTATGAAEITWWDAATGRPVRVLHGEEDVQSLAASPEGRFLCFLDRKRRLPVWDLHAVPPRVFRIDYFDDDVLGTEWAPDGSGFLLCGWVSVELWRPAGGVEYRTHASFSRETLARHVDGVGDIAWSPEGSRFATAQVDGTVTVWRLPEGNPVRRVVAGGLLPALVSPVASPDGKYVMPAGKLRHSTLEESRVFAVDDGTPAGPLLPAGGVLVGAAFSPLGDRAVTLAACLPRPADRSLDEYRADLTPGEVRVWDWRSGTQIIPAVPTPSEPGCAAWSPDGFRLGVLCEGGEVILIDPSGGKVLSRLDHGVRREKLISRQFALDEERVRFSPDRRGFCTWGLGSEVTSGLGSAVRVWSISGQATGTLDHPGATITGARYSPDGRFLATAAYTNVLTVWDTFTLRPACPPIPHPMAVLGIDFSRGGDLILTGCLDNFVRVWDWRKGTLLAPPFQNPWTATPRFAGQDGLVVACGRHSESGWDVRVWEWRTGTPLTPPWPVADRPQTFAVDSRLIFCGDSGASTADLGPIAGDPLELERGLLLGGLLATLKPVGGGRLTKMNAKEWLEGWRKLRRERGTAETIDVSPEARRAWHAARAGALHEENRWDAAAWHLDRLAALGDDVRARRARLEEFVRSWRFAPDTVPWPGPPVLALDDARLASVEEAALAAPLIPSPSPFVDFTSRFAGKRTTWTASYAARSIDCAAPREVRILVGWDDSVRVFVNRKPVLERLGLQPPEPRARGSLSRARPDQSSAIVGLEAGTNVLLVEISNAWGGSGLFLRLEDPVTGRRLRLTDDGKLEDL